MSVAACTMGLRETAGSEDAVIEQQVPQRFEGRTAIVTGAGIGGLGAAYADALAAAGARVVVADIRGPQAEATAEGIEAWGGEAMAVEADVTDEAAVNAMVDATVDRFGGVDILINNAAVMFRFLDKPRDAILGGVAGGVRSGAAGQHHRLVVVCQGGVHSYEAPGWRQDRQRVLQHGAWY